MQVQLSRRFKAERWEIWEVQGGSLEGTLAGSRRGSESLSRLEAHPAALMPGISAAVPAEAVRHASRGPRGSGC